MKHRFGPRELTLLGLLTAILLVMSYTPLGYLNIGPLAITLNMIPVALAAATLGAFGGAFTGAVFGLTSFLQCIGIGGYSAFGAALFAINPVLTFVMCFLPRLAAGLLTGWIFAGIKKLLGSTAAGFAAGFSAAFLNTLLFMTALLGFFSRTEYLQSMIGGMNLLAFAYAFVGINAVFEMIASTAVSGLLYKALERSGVLKR